MSQRAVPPSRPDRLSLIDAKSCSITGALEALGDTWSILVLRELFFGVRRFNDMLTDLGISRSVLTQRLSRLVELGVVRTEPYQEPGDRVRHQYRVTRKGVGLLNAVIALMEWGDEYINSGHEPIELLDRATGGPVQLALRASDGHVVQPNEIEVKARVRAKRAG